MFQDTPDHIYMDLQITNNDIEGQGSPSPIVFSETRNNPFISDTNEYYVSVIRFQIRGTNTLPNWIPLIQKNQPDPNLTIYSFTLQYNYLGTDYLSQKYLTYEPSHPNLTPPQMNDIGENYYYVYSIQQIIPSFNKCLKDSYDELRTLVNTAGGSLPSGNEPFLNYDPKTSLFTLYAPSALYDNDLGNYIKIFMNSPMQVLFSSFPDLHFGYGSSITDGKNFQIIVKNNHNINVETLNSISYLKVYQDWCSTSLWNPVSSVVFQCALLPIVPSLIAKPKDYGTDTIALQSEGNNSNVAGVLTDIEVLMETINSWKPVLLYTPLSEYRLSDMRGQSNINSIQISIFWKDTYGTMHRMYLNNNCSADIKLLFRKKSFKSGGY